MRKLLKLIIFLMILFPVIAFAQGPYEVILQLTSDGSGTTTQQNNAAGGSAVSAMYVTTSEQIRVETSPRIFDDFTLKGFSKFSTDRTFLIQVDTLTLADSELGLGGDPSGVTFELSVKTSIIDDDAAWAGASEYQIYPYMALSGNTERQIDITSTIPKTEYQRWYFRTPGNTQWGVAKFKMIISDPK